MSGADSAAKSGAASQTPQHPEATGNESEGHINTVSFPRSARLLTGADYSCVFKKNQRFSDRYWTILVREDTTQSSKLGLAIAKKRAKRAVDRNKIKRVARESYRHHRGEMDGLQLVVMNRDAAAAEPVAGLRRSIDSLCRKIISKYRRK